MMISSAGIEVPSNPHIGSSVDEFFAEDGMFEEIEAMAIKRVIDPATSPPAAKN